MSKYIKRRRGKGGCSGIYDEPFPIEVCFVVGMLFMYGLTLWCIVANMLKG
jgi:hypothetical protein